MDCSGSSQGPQSLVAGAKRGAQEARNRRPLPETREIHTGLCTRAAKLVAVSCRAGRARVRAGNQHCPVFGGQCSHRCLPRACASLLAAHALMGRACAFRYPKALPCGVVTGPCHAAPLRCCCEPGQPKGGAARGRACSAHACLSARRSSGYGPAVVRAACMPRPPPAYHPLLLVLRPRTPSGFSSDKASRPSAPFRDITRRCFSSHLPCSLRIPAACSRCRHAQKP